LRGRLPTARGIAIVGARNASRSAIELTRVLAAALVADGFAIWSGGAVGIDAAAHGAALDTDGQTVLVSGGGLDRPYPAEHGALYSRVLASGGALLSRVPDGTPPMRAWFLQRNQLLAALTDATVVVEASLVSGARSTAAAARRLGRPLCVVPHSPWDERGQGCVLELTRGAIPIATASDVLAAVGKARPARLGAVDRVGGRAPAATAALVLQRGGPPRSSAASNPGARRACAMDATPLEADERAVLAILTGAPMHVDEACELASLPLPVVVGALVTLTLRTFVVEGPAGFFRKAAPPGATEPEGI
jgi:DNA processing protein